ncbi:MAG: AAA family ATPase [Eubacteriales bacterium]
MRKNKSTFEFKWQQEVYIDPITNEKVNGLGMIHENLFQLAMLLSDDIHIEPKLNENKKIVYSYRKALYRMGKNNEMLPTSTAYMMKMWHNGPIILNKEQVWGIDTDGMTYAKEETPSGETRIHEPKTLYVTAAYIQYLKATGNSEEIEIQRAYFKKHFHGIEKEFRKHWLKAEGEDFCVYKAMCKRLENERIFHIKQGEEILLIHQKEDYYYQYVNPYDFDDSYLREVTEEEKHTGILSPWRETQSPWHGMFQLAKKLQENNLVSFVFKGDTINDFLTGEKMIVNYLETIDYYRLCGASLGEKLGNLSTALEDWMSKSENPPYEVIKLGLSSQVYSVPDVILMAGYLDYRKKCFQYASLNFEKIRQYWDWYYILREEEECYDALLSSDYGNEEQIVPSYVYIWDDANQRLDEYVASNYALSQEIDRFATIYAYLYCWNSKIKQYERAESFEIWGGVEEVENEIRKSRIYDMPSKEEWIALLKRKSLTAKTVPISNEALNEKEAVKKRGARQIQLDIKEAEAYENARFEIEEKEKKEEKRKLREEKKKLVEQKEYYQKYRTTLSRPLRELADENPEHPRIFGEYWNNYGHKFHPQGKELAVFLANFSNEAGKLVLPDLEERINKPALEKLKKMIGLGNASQQIADLQKYVQYLEEGIQHGMNFKEENKHMIFTGNPGTGKTMVARLFAEILYDLGLTRRKEIVEVDRKDLVAGWIGQTAPLVTQVVEKAVGGVLFIDEAYSLTPASERDFGHEAIATLIKAMEDHKGDLIVILAGYQKEMREFVRSNPGIKSRIAFEVDFRDYTVDELVEITDIALKEKGFLYDKKEITLKLADIYQLFHKFKNFGNARFAMDVIQKITIKRAIRHDLQKKNGILQNKPGGYITELIAEDIPTGKEMMALDTQVLQDYETKLEEIIGMETVKERVQDFKDMVLFQRKAKAEGATIPASNMHMIFTGNPGTGKTTIAHLMANMLYQMDIISRNHVEEVNPRELAEDPLSKTRDALEAARGGVLFIDEAYGLVLNEQDIKGQQVVDILLKEMEEFQDTLIVIFAGYEDKMRQFLDSNAGIKSRIGDIFHFDNYTVDQLYLMYRNLAKRNGFTLGPNVEHEVKDVIKAFSTTKYFGNGRFIDELFHKTLLLHGKHLKKDESNLLRIEKEDIPDPRYMKNSPKVTETLDLDHIIGLNKVKEQIKAFEQLVKFTQKAKNHKLRVPDFNYHMIFSGNPGTGKTTVAKVLAKKLYEIGVITENKCKVVERKDLIATHIGHTAQKVADVIESAMGGVLFIDEAYSLVGKSENDFGAEAIETLITAMEIYKDNLIVIFAGYEDHMEKFKEANPGIASRIGFYFQFEDYTTEELYDIFDSKVKSCGFSLGSSVEVEVKKLMQYFSSKPAFGNGRFVEKVFRVILEKHGKNCDSRDFTGKPALEKQYLEMILAKDIPSIEEMTKLMDNGKNMPLAENYEEEAFWRIAVHEVGHGLVQMRNFPKSKIEKITIKPEANGALGYMQRELELGTLYTKEEYCKKIAVSMAGLAAETVTYGNYADGGSSDIKSATNVAKHMIQSLGMSKYGFAGSGDKKEETAEINEMLEQEYQNAMKLIEKEKVSFDKAVDYLMEKKVITEEEFKKFW